MYGLAQVSEVTDSVEYLVACCDRRPLIWRRCEGASRGVFCPGTSPRWTLCRWAGSCKGSLPHRTALNMSGKTQNREIYIDIIEFFHQQLGYQSVRINLHHFVLALFDNLLYLTLSEHAQSLELSGLCSIQGDCQ